MYQYSLFKSSTLSDTDKDVFALGVPKNQVGIMDMLTGTFWLYLMVCNLRAVWRT